MTSVTSVVKKGTRACSSSILTSAAPDGTNIAFTASLDTSRRQKIIPHVALQTMALVVLQQGIQIPAPVGFVNDFASVISEESRARMTRLIEEVRTKSGGEITVVTLADIGDRDVADVALQVGRQWRVGKAAQPGDPARNTGTVVLIVPKETNSSGMGRCRIEVANGAEGFITDGITGRVCRDAIPFFQRRDYSGAIELILQGIASAYAGEFNFALSDSVRVPAITIGREPSSQRGPTSNGSGSLLPFFIALAIVFVMFRLVSRSTVNTRRGANINPLLWAILASMNQPGRGRRSRGWGGGGGFGGGGGGGGFGGFGGGGGFSGGGGGSSW